MLPLLPKAKMHQRLKYQRALDAFVSIRVGEKKPVSKKNGFLVIISHCNLGAKCLLHSKS